MPTQSTVCANSNLSDLGVSRERWLMQPVEPSGHVTAARNPQPSSLLGLLHCRDSRGAAHCLSRTEVDLGLTGFIEVSTRLG